jgi:6,7-dimethyl-8-ribityllumazine synthase
MPTERKGDLSAKGLRLAVVVSRFNSFITERLLAGALDALERAGGDNKKIEVVRVPGSFEIPVAAKRLAETGRYDALICLGCIIRGQTQHFDYISAEVTRGIQLAAIETGVPLAFGVLTTDTLAVEMANLLKRAGNRSHR